MPLSRSGPIAGRATRHRTATPQTTRIDDAAGTATFPASTALTTPRRFADRLQVELLLREAKRDPLVMRHLREILRDREPSLALSRTSDESVIRRLAGTITSGRLVVSGALDPRDERTEADDAALTSPFLVEDRLLRTLRARDREFTFEGRKIRLVRADRPDLPTELTEWKEYHIVPRPEAVKTLQRMAADPLLSKAERAALAETIPLVAETTRKAGEGGILLLAMRLLAGTAAAAAEPAPPQVARTPTKTLHWIAIELLGEDGSGIPNEQYLIVTPDQQEHTGTTDAQGRARLDGIPAGPCKIRFTRLDLDAWDAA